LTRSLPVTWRPRRARVVAYTLAGTIVSGMTVLAIVVAPTFGLGDRIGLVVFGLFVAGVLHLLARCRVEADEQGLTVVNAIRTHRYDWAEVLGIAMAEGEPWPTLDLADGSSVGAMGIQGAERERAKKAIAELSALLHERGEAAEPS
jgi:PH (Pleckstrin Homology) domain-containing protein